MRWKLPPKIKIYEALGCIGDKRIEVSGNSAKVFSSSRKKFYTLEYDGASAIMANDNGSFWVGYLSYPSIAFMMLVGKIRYNPKFASALAGIPWKDLNTKFKNDYSKTEAHVLEFVKDRVDVAELKSEIDDIYGQIKKLGMKLFGKKMKPPSGY